MAKRVDSSFATEPLIDLGLGSTNTTSPSLVSAGRKCRADGTKCVIHTIWRSVLGKRLVMWAKYAYAADPSGLSYS